MKRCSMCDKEFDIYDEQLSFEYIRRITYGSKHDEEDCRLQLCCDCFDKVIDLISPMCKHSILKEVG